MNHIPGIIIVNAALSLCAVLTAKGDWSSKYFVISLALFFINIVICLFWRMP